MASASIQERLNKLMEEAKVLEEEDRRLRSLCVRCRVNRKFNTYSDCEKRPGRYCGECINKYCNCGEIRSTVYWAKMDGDYSDSDEMMNVCSVKCSYCRHNRKQIFVLAPTEDDLPRWDKDDDSEDDSVPAEKKL